MIQELFENLILLRRPDLLIVTFFRHSPTINNNVYSLEFMTLKPDPKPFFNNSSKFSEIIG